MKLLAIETSSNACSAALLNDDKVIEDFKLAPKQHAALILSQVDAVLNSENLTLKDLDAIAFAKGPGSFTGLRIACAVTQGLAFSADLPVIAVSTLQTLAQGAYREFQSESVLSALDARMNEIYWGHYILDENKIMQASTEDSVSAASKVDELELGNAIGVGDGFTVYENNNLKKVAPDFNPHAKDIITIAIANPTYLSPEEITPLYIRDKIAS